MARSRTGLARGAADAADAARVLAFVNTLSGRPTRSPVERLTSCDALVAWVREAGLLPAPDSARLAAAARRRRGAAERLLGRARRLRELLHRTLAAITTGRAPAEETLAALGAQLAGWQRRGRLVSVRGALRWVYGGGDDLDRPLWEIARAASRLLTSPQLVRVRTCAAADCGWWFLDATKNGSRRWCDMKVCGNREKVRRFRAGHRD
jgi:predicted RNA-binding Zn ribbon-like protein